MENRRMVYTLYCFTCLAISSMIPGVGGHLQAIAGGDPGGEQWAKSSSITFASRDPKDGVAAKGVHGRFRRAVQSDLRTFLLDAHNAARRQEYSSDMEHMRWNSELASMALDWARGCRWEHGQPFRSNPPFSQIGQNLYATTASPLDLAEAMRAWGDEEKIHYRYDTGTCVKQPCGHYTQIVWSTTREVGCAEYFCPNLVNAFSNANYLVCNYGPAGNYNGVKPFRRGESCTKCESGQFWCDNGLCRRDCSSSSNCNCAANCQNQGIMRSDCTCTCQGGFAGSDCSERCANKHAYCGANPGWPQSWCEGNQYSDYISSMCPLLCGTCNPSTGVIVSTTTTTPTTTTTTTTTTTPTTTTTTSSTTTSRTCRNQCRNQGILSSNCTCLCQDGFMGSDCSVALRCEDKSAYCGATPGWPRSWCNGHQYSTYMRSTCPRLCGVCGGQPCEDKHEYCGADPGWPQFLCNDCQNSDYIRSYCPRMCGVCN